LMDLGFEDGRRQRGEIEKFLEQGIVDRQ
jgi:hypothetical protein